jgi:putative transposon-encoded protein
VPITTMSDAVRPTSSIIELPLRRAGRRHEKRCCGAQLRIARRWNDAGTVTFQGVRGMVKKTVKAQGTSVRIYVPPAWIGKRAVVLLLDDE